MEVCLDGAPVNLPGPESTPLRVSRLAPVTESPGPARSPALHILVQALMLLCLGLLPVQWGLRLTSSYACSKIMLVRVAPTSLHADTLLTTACRKSAASRAATCSRKFSSP
jgi:hypothetical protein